MLPYREPDDAVGVPEIAEDVLTNTRRGKNGRHCLVRQFRESAFGRLGGYDDVNDAERLSLDPVMRWIVGGHAVTKQAASISQMRRYETEVLATEENLAALADFSGQWVDSVRDRHPPTWIILDMDSSVSPIHDDLGRCSLRPGNVYSADDRDGVLKPVVVRYKSRKVRLYFRGDAAFTSPEIYNWESA